MSLGPHPLPKEAPRDQVESAFTPILRRLRQKVPSVLAAVFVDTEGECIDYASALEPYDAKVNAAHMLVFMDMLRRSRDKVGLGEPLTLEIEASDREVWVQRIGDEYVLVTVMLPGYDRLELKSALAIAASEFEQEIGFAPAEAADGADQRLSVRVRASPGWQYAPEGWSAGGIRVVISDVLGRWMEARDDGGEDLICFRVRTVEGQELTLVHDPSGEGWIVRE